MGCEADTRSVAEEQLMKPLVFFGEKCENLPLPTKPLLLPPGVKLLTLERWNNAGNSSVLVRLENMLETDIETDLTELLSVITTTGNKDIIQMALDGSQRLEDMERLVWNTGGNTGGSRQEYRGGSKAPVFTVGARMIITLLVSEP